MRTLRKQQSSVFRKLSVHKKAKFGSIKNSQNILVYVVTVPEVVYVRCGTGVGIRKFDVHEKTKFGSIKSITHWFT